MIMMIKSDFGRLTEKYGNIWKQVMLAFPHLRILHMRMLSAMVCVSIYDTMKRAEERTNGSNYTR